MECNRHNFLPFCTIFLPFYPPNNLKNQNFEKWKKYGGIITLHLRTTNDDHMMYGSWDMEHDRHNFLSLFGYVLLFYAPNNLENQNFEKMKKYTKNHDHMPYCSWDMVRDECNCYFSFWAIFPFYPRNSPRNQNLKKKEKKTSGDIILHKCTKNYDQTYGSWDTARNGRTDGQTEKVTYRGWCPPKKQVWQAFSKSVFFSRMSQMVKLEIKIKNRFFGTTFNILAFCGLNVSTLRNLLSKIGQNRVTEDEIFQRLLT